MKKILAVFGGIVLVILGVCALGFCIIFNNNVVLPIILLWYFLLFLSGILFVISGVGLFFFKKWAWKGALLSYKIVLLHIILANILMYSLIIGYVGRAKPWLFSISNIIYYLRHPTDYSLLLSMTLIPVFFIFILNLVREEFGIVLVNLNKTKPKEKFIRLVKNNEILLIALTLILIFGSVFVKYFNRRMMVNQVCFGKCNLGPVPGPLVNIDNACYKKCIENGYSKIFKHAEWLREMNVKY